jgi:alpha-beta hydrolase superfamily lysophospholipase
LPESEFTPFKGNIVYLQGLGDSIQNHDPLFSALSEAGYRIIAFDYFGQGGSEGSMNDTRISDIVKIGLQVFHEFGRDLDRRPRPIMLGWSTGGLAAYLAAQKNLADAVILIAPGLVPNWKVGTQDYYRFKFNRITLESLTTDRYDNGNYNPHVDPIKPSSPLDVKDFALNLQKTAARTRQSDFTIPRDVKGFVLLSGDKDTYVNAAATEALLQRNANHFQVIQYEGSLHEIDNEVTEIRDLVQKDILNFLKSMEN